MFFDDWGKGEQSLWTLWAIHRKKLQEKIPGKALFYFKLQGKSVGFPGFFPGVFSKRRPRLSKSQHGSFRR